MSTEYKVEILQVNYEQGKWYEGAKALDKFSLDNAMESVLNEYASLGYELVSQTPLIDNEKVHGHPVLRTTNLVLTFKKSLASD